MQATSAAALTSPRAPYPRRGELPFAPPATDLGLRLQPRRAVELGGSIGGLLVAITGNAAWPAHGLIAGALGAAVFIGSLWATSRRARQLNAENQRLIHRMESFTPEGVAEAIDGFRRAARTSGLSAQRSVALANLSIALSHRGDHDEALRVLALAERTYRKARKQPYGQVLALHAAHVFALWGDGDGADAWMQEAAKRGASPEMLDITWTPVLIRLRQRRPADALALIDERFLSWEARVPGAGMRRVRVLKALARQMLGRPEADVDDALVGTRPFAPLDYAAMATSWPELHSFLVDKKLVP